MKLENSSYSREPADSCLGEATAVPRGLPLLQQGWDWGLYNPSPHLHELQFSILSSSSCEEQGPGISGRLLNSQTILFIPPHLDGRLARTPSNCLC